MAKLNREHNWICTPTQQDLASNYSHLVSSASEMTYIVYGGALNSTPSPSLVRELLAYTVYFDW